MLFLFNDRVVEIELPEMRLARRWRALGCGDPTAMRARDAVEFARAVVDQSREDDQDLDTDTLVDLAALVVAKTGANAIQFIPRISGPSEARLSSVLPEALEAFRARAPDRGESVLLAAPRSWSAA